MSNFRTIEWAAWETWFPIVSFVLISAVFIAILVRALFMPQKKIDHIANLPLESDEEGLARIEREENAEQKNEEQKSAEQKVGKDQA